jgi:hypothetical protein
MPRSRAMRRASGEALMRAPAPSVWTGSRTSVTCSAADAARPSARSGSRAGASAGFSALCGAPPFPSSGTSSPCSPITAMVVPTSASPSATAILSRTPDASASTSCVTLSVSSS